MLICLVLSYSKIRLERSTVRGAAHPLFTEFQVQKKTSMDVFFC